MANRHSSSDASGAAVLPERKQPPGEILIASAEPEVSQGADGTTLAQRPIRMMRLSGLAGTFFILVLLVVELSGASILALGDRAFPTPILIGASVWMSLFGLAMYFYRSGITVPPHGAEFVLWKEILGYRWKSRRRASDVRAVAVCVSVTDEDEPASHLYSVRAVLSDGRVLPVQRHAAKATAILWGERVGKLLNADVVDWTGAA